MLVAALVLLPIIEIITLIWVGKTLGVLPTLGLLVGMAVLGAWLARRETGRTYAALNKAVQTGRMPTDEVTDAILVMVGGFLLILPGFVTDLVGLLLVLPFTRPAARRLLQTVVAAKALGVTRGGRSGGAGAGSGDAGTGRGGQPGRGQVIEGEVVSEEPPPWSTERRPGALD